MYCPVVDDNFFQECVIALERKAGYPRKWLLAQKMRWRLRIYKKDNLLGRWLGYLNFIKASSDERSIPTGRNDQWFA